MHRVSNALILNKVAINELPWTVFVSVGLCPVRDYFAHVWSQHCP